MIEMQEAPRPLSEPERARAVELVEAAIRENEFCMCGAHMSAVGKDDGIWLECSKLDAPREGLSRFVPFAGSSLWHARRLIVELPH